MKTPEPGIRKALQRRRTKSGYTFIRVTKVTRALLAKLEAQHDEPLDALIFYLAAHELGHNYVALLSVIDTALANRRVGVAAAGHKAAQ